MTSGKMHKFSIVQKEIFADNLFNGSIGDENKNHIDMDKK